MLTTISFGVAKPSPYQYTLGRRRSGLSQNDDLPSVTEFFSVDRVVYHPLAIPACVLVQAGMTLFM